MQAHTIQEVIDLLDEIAQESARNQSPMGYFPTLYRKVTIEIRDRIACKQFEDCARMERLDVAFANRYFEAYESYRQGRPLTRSWKIAFDTTHDERVSVLQHLFLGINAHICLDLGVASAQLMPGDSIFDLKTDFELVSQVLASLTDYVQNDVKEIWKPMKYLDFLGGKQDERLADWVIHTARKGAWEVATSFHCLSENKHPEIIAQVDRDTAHTAQILAEPPLAARLAFNAMRMMEQGSPADKIAALR